jgi:hypothetical protein
MDLADRHGAPLVDRWGRSHVIIDDGVDLEELHHLSRRNGYTITAFLSEERIVVPIGERLPDPADQARAAALATFDRVRNEVTDAGNGTAIVEILYNDIDEIEVAYSRPGWARTVDALNASLQEDWPNVADNLHADTVEVGGHQIALRHIVSEKEGPKNSLPITIPNGPRPSVSDATTVWDALVAVGHAAAWTNLAVATSRRGSEVLLALHHDQDPTIELTLTNAAGGVDLFRWWTASEDGNREEALRHVLRLVTAARSTLPDPRVVLRLAERQHIALTREHAAEVHRAITEGQRDTAAAMKDATDAFGDLIEESTRTANATVVAVLGLIALVARSADDLPEWLVGAVALAAVAGVVAVVQSRLSRIADQEQLVERLRRRLENDPLLPDDDRAAAINHLGDFDLAARAARARRIVLCLGASAAIVVCAAAVWLILTHRPSSAESSTSTRTNVPGPLHRPPDRPLPWTSSTIALFQERLGATDLTDSAAPLTARPSRRSSPDEGDLRTASPYAGAMTCHGSSTVRQLRHPRATDSADEASVTGREIGAEVVPHPRRVARSGKGRTERSQSCRLSAYRAPVDAARVTGGTALGHRDAAARRPCKPLTRVRHAGRVLAHIGSSAAPGPRWTSVGT